MVRVRGLSKTFLNGKLVLNGIDLDVRPGDALAIWGANGAGKTTFLRILATLAKPTRGEVSVGGFSVQTHARSVRGVVGWVPAGDGGLFPRLNGFDNLLFAASACQVGRKCLEEQLGAWREIASFRDALTTPAYLCSSGMKQQLATARALISNPDVLLLDEPNRSLDPESRILAQEIIRFKTRNKVLIFTTHSKEEAEGLANRNVTLKGGRIDEIVHHDFVSRISQ